MNQRAQGTIEYLVIIAIVVVISLVVVALLLNQTSSVSDTQQKTTNLAWQTKDIQVAEFIADPFGKGKIALVSNLDRGITLKSIIVDDLGNSSSHTMYMGSSKTISLGNIPACTGKTQAYEVKVEYTTVEGLNKSVSGTFVATCTDQTSQNLKQVILIGVDGVQYAHYREMMTAGTLPNFVKLIGSSGFDGNATITGHTTATETQPGNAELHTGIGSDSMGIPDNTPAATLADGITTFERLETYNSGIVTGSIYGKNTGYVPNILLNNADDDIDWWKKMNGTGDANYSYVFFPDASSSYADSISVATAATDFITSNYDKNFYLFVYFGVPDGVGHSKGENSTEYANAIVNVDDGIEILLNSLNEHDILSNTKIILSGDHGWKEGATTHSTPDINTSTILLLSNDSSLVSNLPTGGVRRQCDVAPTILDYFGMTASQYSDISCESLSE